MMLVMKTYTGSLQITKEALLQIYTIKKNDFTLGSCEFRIRIDGKGCNGFTYDMGFSEPQNDDFCLSLSTKAGTIRIILDPFTAFYVKNAKLSFEKSDTDDIGFVLENFDEKNHEGKFFKDESLLPDSDHHSS